MAQTSAAKSGLIKLRRTRAEKLDATRRALFDAAIQIVGEEGYANASVFKITRRAHVAHGTFYNYFGTQQDLFDELLPMLGERLLAHIRAHLDVSVVGVERERRRIEAYFSFCRKTPGFLRILNEAEVFAPKAFHTHVKRFFEGYLHSLRRSAERGEIRGYEEQDLPVIVFMLMGMRSYLTMLYQHNYVDRDKLTITALIDAYSQFVGRALFERLPGSSVRQVTDAASRRAMNNGAARTRK
jgi:AcrR family transcriptional regulator